MKKMPIDKNENEVDIWKIKNAKKTSQKSKAENEEFLKSIGANPSIPTLVIAARLTAVKGQKYIIEAAKMLKDKQIPFQIIIAGTGEESENLRKLAENLGVLGDYIILAGFISDIEGLMNACDIQLNASFGTEAASLALMEGMSLGKPTIATNIGGNPYVIESGQNGLVVPMNNPEALASGIKRFMEDSDFYRITSENAKRIYKEKFTVAAMVTGTERIYYDLVHKG